MRSGIGGLLAQSGANIGSQIGGAYGQLGSDIGGMLSGIGAKRQQKKQTREVQELLAKYQNNPAQLNAVSAKYASEGNDALAKVFAQAAQRAKESNQQKVTRQEKRREVAGQRAEKVGARIDAASTELDTEIKKRRAVAIAKGRPQDADLVPLLEQDLLSAEDYGKGITGKKGSQAKPTVVQETVMRDGRPLKVVQIYDSGGNLLKEHVVGEAPPKDEDGKDPFATKWASDILTNEREQIRTAEQKATDFGLLEKEVADKSLMRRGGFGTAVGAAEEILGIAGAAQEHRRRITKLRTSGVLDLLPPGVASDKDVQLAMNASVDPNKLDNETAQTYFRGMRIIAEAEAEYGKAKVLWMTKTGDPNAVGFDVWVEKVKAANELQEAQTGPAMQELLARLQEAQETKDPQQKKARMLEMQTLFPKELKLVQRVAETEASFESLENVPQGFY